MKKITFYLLALLTALSLVVVSCEKDGGDDGNDNNNDKDGSSASKITMTVHSDAVAGMMVVGEVLTGITISWGDGTTDNYTYWELLELMDDEGDDAITHSYPSTADYTITITGKQIATLFCGENQLTSLDVSQSTALMFLSCDDNQLTALDVNKNTALTSLICSSNQLTALDVSKNTALTSLFCDDNQLTSLDVSQSTALMFLYCDDNQLSASALNTLFGTLHSNAGTTAQGKIISIGWNPGTSTCDRSIATNKGWTVN